MKVLSKNNKVIIADGHAIEWQGGNGIPLKVLTRNNKLLLADGKALRNPKLPTIYQQVKYISATSNNGAYIDLGIQYANGCTLEIGWVYTGNSLQLFGATADSGKYRCLLSAHFNGVGMSYYGTINNNFSYIQYPPNDTTVGKVMNQRAVYNSNGYIEDLDTGEKKNFNIQDYSVSNNLFLLGQNYNGNYRGNGLKQITYFKYADKNGTMLRDMIPCYRKSDNVIGMFDLVSQTFFTNAGTGVFTVGEDA